MQEQLNQNLNPNWTSKSSIFIFTLFKLVGTLTNVLLSSLSQRQLSKQGNLFSS